ncbi:MAG: 2-dehydropantoate 2-reductase [Paludibacteraceae bacterium]|nr:2-dehydropantoate 2-reductase [Paludibacteraceae bacterium]
MKIAIIGTGGVGGYFGAKLLQAGNEVSFLARGEHLRVMQQHGLRVKSILGDFQTPPCKASDEIADLGVVDLIIIGVKAWQIQDLAPQLVHIMHKNTIILPLQNGVIAAEELAKNIDSTHIIGGLCRIVSMISAPGCIDHTGVVPTIVFGEFNKADDKRLLAVQTLFNEAGIKNILSKNIEAELWKKLLLICISGLMAVTRSTYGEMNEIPATRQMMIGLLTEIATISNARGTTLNADIVERTVEFLDTMPYDTTYSLTRDVWEGKPSEIEYQNGIIAKLGKQFGIPTPVNEFIYNAILPMERKARMKKA